MKAKIEIVMEDTGQVGVSYPDGNPLLCYGLLEVAKDVIRAAAAKKAASPILPASALPLSLVE